MSLIWLGEQSDLDRKLVGGKAHSINRMLDLGLPVPPAFVLSTEFCSDVIANDGQLTSGAEAALREGLTRLEKETGRSLGGHSARPLLISVRSGGALSMPGMMDTVLNLGINDEIEAKLADRTGDAAFAADTHRRFREQFAKVVGTPATGDPWEDLRAAAAAVFRSWCSPRAVAYRKHHGIGENGGTAVTVQAMVFGNLDDDSGTGVLFTRNPMTGDATPYGEWLPRGQGEDVVSGRHDALPLDSLARQMPDVHAELLEAARKLESLGKDVQDIEFTVQSGKLWLLQTRAAKRSPQASVKIALGLQQDGIISREEAVGLVTPSQLDAVMRPHIDPVARTEATVLARGVPACPGVATGRVVGSCEEAESLTDEGIAVVLARPTTDPDDVSGMVVSDAIITEIGGSTSHAAVVSRELGTPCVVGCGQGTVVELVGRDVTVDGTTGEIFDGILPVISGESEERAAARTLADWSAELTSKVLS
ncbi:pyruvate, phosphate dikinase [Rhodococcus rhodochrous]|uniref:pyruvate, phosphate dikinase n=1 Tax=Rhodococcus rhodochrous TaxID=1829 RepID=UPI0006C8C195|nr:pyruvate, phosphate dikinase [Rhodococcus rhodochrous]